ncbi:hypothetical protein DFH11DRAFT_1514322 [Phellopilus nigrolimitatus]|nr:hypothetical protein DFH11DRAFT_1514322 [Phellopilus nigrolimitatus]
MSKPTKVQLKTLKSAFVNNKPPYCAGSFALPLESFTLFYGKDENARRINLANASVDQLKHLVEACDPATLGLDQKDVHDESYRKALKLDGSNFATKLDVVRSGLVDSIRNDLLEGDKGRRSISAELYKLNIYGKDSFFRAHQDTPRGANMFGSLVLVLPTPHEGGSLVLRHEGKEWSFDSAKVLAEQLSPSIGYVAFFSDVEHEVLPVKSGHRVTITYNLYFGDGEIATGINGLGAYESSVKVALSGLLQDPTFFPEGGYLGFGLRHAYPLETKHNKEKLSVLKECLKGIDATVMKACTDLSLDTSLKLLYEDSKAEVLLDDYVPLEHWVVYEDSEALWYDLWKNYKGVLVRPSSYDKDKFEPDINLVWVTERTLYNQLKLYFGAYGTDRRRRTLTLSSALMSKWGLMESERQLRRLQRMSSTNGVDCRNKICWEMLCTESTYIS